ncbi:MAG: hypothetical protein RSE46_13900, partial [Janthinobacterium sp.]
MPQRQRHTRAVQYRAALRKLRHTLLSRRFLLLCSMLFARLMGASAYYKSLFLSNFGTACCIWSGTTNKGL